jgi:hypothetical protein
MTAGYYCTLEDSPERWQLDHTLLSDPTNLSFYTGQRLSSGIRNSSCPYTSSRRWRSINPTKHAKLQNLIWRRRTQWAWELVCVPLNHLSIHRAYLSSKTVTRILQKVYQNKLRNPKSPTTSTSQKDQGVEYKHTSSSSNTTPELIRPARGVAVENVRGDAFPCQYLSTKII